MAAIQYRQFPGPGIYTLQYAAGNLPTAIDIYCGGGGAGGQGIGLGGRGGGGGGMAVVTNFAPAADTPYTINVGDGGAGGFVVYRAGGVVDSNQGASPGQWTLFSSANGPICWAGGGGLASVNYQSGVGKTGATLWSGGVGGIIGYAAPVPPSLLADDNAGGGGGEGAKRNAAGASGEIYYGGGAINGSGSGGKGGRNPPNAFQGLAGVAFGENIGCAGGGGGGGRGVASSVVVGQARVEASNERGARGGPGHCTIVQYFP